MFRRALPLVLLSSTMRVSYATMPLARVRHPAPAWSAPAASPDLTLTQISSDAFRNKYLVMVFYPRDFTFVCPTELTAFSDSLDKFKELGADVVGVSVDSEHAHLAWMKMKRSEGGVEGLRIPLIADVKKEISEKYGVLHDDGTALRGMFIIDKKGELRVAHINDFPIGRSVDEAIRLLEAIRFTDEHGEVCPANWKKGMPTMKDNPVDCKEYFSHVKDY